MFYLVQSIYGYPKYHVMGPDGEIRLANVHLKDALRIAAMYESGAIADVPRLPVCCHGQPLDGECFECWYYN